MKTKNYTYYLIACFIMVMLSPFIYAFLFTPEKAEYTMPMNYGGGLSTYSEFNLIYACNESWYAQKFDPKCDQDAFLVLSIDGRVIAEEDLPARKDFTIRDIAYEGPGRFRAELWDSKEKHVLLKLND